MSAIEQAPKPRRSSAVRNAVAARRFQADRSRLREGSTAGTKDRVANRPNPMLHIARFLDAGGAAKRAERRRRGQAPSAAPAMSIIDADAVFRLPKWNRRRRSKRRLRVIEVDVGRLEPQLPPGRGLAKVERNRVDGFMGEANPGEKLWVRWVQLRGLFGKAVCKVVSRSKPTALDICATASNGLMSFDLGDSQLGVVFAHNLGEDCKESPPSTRQNPQRRGAEVSPLRKRGDDPLAVGIKLKATLRIRSRVLNEESQRPELGSGHFLQKTNQGPIGNDSRGCESDGLKHNPRADCPAAAASLPKFPVNARAIAKGNRSKGALRFTRALPHNGFLEQRRWEERSRIVEQRGAEEREVRRIHDAVLQALGKFELSKKRCDSKTCNQGVVYRPRIATQTARPRISPRVGEQASKETFLYGTPMLRIGLAEQFANRLDNRRARELCKSGPVSSSAVPNKIASIAGKKHRNVFRRGCVEIDFNTPARFPAERRHNRPAQTGERSYCGGRRSRNRQPRRDYRT